MDKLNHIDKSYSHYNGVVLSAIASQIPGASIVRLTVYSGRSNKTSKLCVTDLCEGNPLWGDSLHKGPVTRKKFPFDDVIMQKSKRNKAQVKYVDILLATMCESAWLIWTYSVQKSNTH